MHPQRSATNGVPDATLPFADRDAAGRVLADLLLRSGAAVRPPDAPAVVLAIPRGGVPIGVAVARALGAPLDVLVAHKVSAPGEPELAIGAVATDGTARLEPWARDAGLVDAGSFRRAADAEIERARRREATLRAGRSPEPLTGRTAILVDDGMATGATMYVAVLAARSAGAARVVVAVPVASVEAVTAIRAVADVVVVAATPSHFYAVGEWYRRFDQLDDNDVVTLLAGAGPGH
jgi:predicted phosphoribosyltransferase